MIMDKFTHFASSSDNKKCVWMFFTIGPSMSSTALNTLLKLSYCEITKDIRGKMCKHFKGHVHILWSQNFRFGVFLY